MVRRLTELRIDEISSVDRGANDGAKVALLKRDDDSDAANDRDLVSRLADMLCEAQPGATRREALHWLLHSPKGRALLQHIATNKRVDNTMTNKSVERIIKNAGVE